MEGNNVRDGHVAFPELPAAFGGRPSRSWVSTMFGRLQKQGIVSMRNRRIVIVRPAQLKEMT